MNYLTHKNGTTTCLHAVGEECAQQLELDLYWEKFCDSCLKHYILHEELIVTVQDFYKRNNYCSHHCSNIHEAHKKYLKLNHTG